MKKIFPVLALVLIFKISFSQTYYLPQGEFYKIFYSKHLTEADTICHSVLQPLQYAEYKQITKKDFRIFSAKSKHKLFNRLFYDDQVIIKKKNIEIRGNLLLDLHKGRCDSDTTVYWQNTRGFNIYGTLGNKVGFYTEFFENQQVFLPYITDRINQTIAIPGRANWKDFGDKGKDFNFSTAYLVYAPKDWLNIQLGYSKFFIGNGYRSLFLSDASSPYAFLKFDFKHRHWRYITIMTEFQHFRGRYYSYHSKRHATINVLSWANKFLEISFLEGILWHTSDDSTFTKRFPALFFLQIPAIREPILWHKEENKIITGFNLKIRPLKYVEIYGQLITDNFLKQKPFKNSGYQGGIKFYDLFFNSSDKINLFVNLEINRISPLTYMNFNPYEAWANYNQMLAHPLGNGFYEKIARTQLKFYRLLIKAGFSQALKVNSLENSAYLNLFYPYEEFLQQETFVYKITNISFSVGYILNYKNGLELFAGRQIRKVLDENSNNQKITNFVSFGIRTNLSNFYYDF